MGGTIFRRGVGDTSWMSSSLHRAILGRSRRTRLWHQCLYNLKPFFWRFTSGSLFSRICLIKKKKKLPKTMDEEYDVIVLGTGLTVRILLLNDYSQPSLSLINEQGCKHNFFKLYSICSGTCTFYFIQLNVFFFFSCLFV